MADESCPTPSPIPNGVWTPTPDEKILPGTKFETGVYVREAERDGPTAVVVAGQHGFERSAQDAAMRLVSLTPEKGKLVVVPHADMTAINAHSYSGDLGNLNRDWPTGDEPQSELAREIWGVIEDHDPDLAFDLHDSKGIYGSDLADGVGQAIFPTPKGVDAANDVIDGLNDHYIGPSEYSDEYLFTRGNQQTGRNPLLSHKFCGDLDIPGWLIETTRHETSLTDRITWCFAAAAGCLAHHGIEFEF
ncbi:M14 family metallopeptidase [Natronococcus wangiae]|uniref:thioredoxin n=1 Tax=Natronococcus wangiae TaxID=3068275 RepID=UPI00273D3109|nr:thioredoxin [Natronococcus sp. AD5]